MIAAGLLAGLLLAGSATLAAAEEVTFVTCDNGLRCIRAPCPARDVVLLPSGRRLARTEPDLSGLNPADRKRLAEGDGLYYGTVVLSGTIEGGSQTRVIARGIVRPATAAEASLCRRQK